MFLLKFSKVLMIVFASRPVENDLLSVHPRHFLQLLLDTFLKVVKYCVLKINVVDELMRYMRQLPFVDSDNFESKANLPILGFSVLTTTNKPLHSSILMFLLLILYLLSF